MKKNRLIWVVILAAFLLALQGCNPKEKKPGTVMVTPAQDTSKVIDTTIFEPGDAPIASMAKVKSDKIKKEKISCGFGLKKFNNRKRPIEEAPGGKKGKPVKPGTEPPPPPPPPTGSNNVIYINYFGKTISGTMWNTNGTFTVQDAGLAQSEIDYITTQVRAHFPEYNITITLDPAIYSAAPIGHKVEVVVTEDYQWYGQAGGVAYINSFFWTDGSPAFVFSLLLNYNGHNIAEAIAHEAGHTLGLRHQSVCVDGVITSQYNWGANGDAPTMGASYNVALGRWYPDGPTPLGCTFRQNDPAILTAAVGLR
jgi:hypothetical protein